MAFADSGTFGKVSLTFDDHPLAGFQPLADRAVLAFAQCNLYLPHRDLVVGSDQEDERPLLPRLYRDRRHGYSRPKRTGIRL